MEFDMLRLITELIDDNVTWDHRQSWYPPAKEEEDPKMHLMKLLDKHNIQPKKVQVEKKSVELSNYWRKEGNAHYSNYREKEGLNMASLLYTKSAAYAPNESGELATIYANKSAVLFRLGLYQECIQTIDHCLTLNYPNKLKGKVLCRKVECFVLLGDAAGAKKCYDLTQKWIEKNAPKSCKDEMKRRLETSYEAKAEIENQKVEHVASREDFYKDFGYNTPSKELPSASKAITLSYNETYGRHLLATRDIRPGEIIAKETAYSSVAKANIIYTVCWGCLKMSADVVPCDCCVYVVYCSVKCKRESWRKFHDVECEVLPHLLQLNMCSQAKEIALASLRLLNYNDGNIEDSSGNIAISAFRLTVLAIKELGSIQKLREEIDQVDKWEDPRTKGFSEKNKFDSRKYRSVYGLSTVYNAKDCKVFQERLFMATMSAYILATRTTFFGKKFEENWKELMDDEDVKFVIDIMLKNSQIEYSNGFAARETFFVDIHTGIRILPLFGFLNHSCYPNAFVTCNSNKASLIALHPIKEGQQIYISYIHNALEEPKNSRQKMLMGKFQFSCNCIACKEDWPLHNKFPNYKDVVKNQRTQDILINQFLKVQKYMNNPKLMEPEDKSLLLKRFRNTVEVFCKYIKPPCREFESLRTYMMFLLEELITKESMASK